MYSWNEGTPPLDGDAIIIISLGKPRILHWKAAPGYRQRSDRVRVRVRANINDDDDDGDDDDAAAGDDDGNDVLQRC